MANLPITGSCVRVPDGRIGRVRDKKDGKVRVRVRRKTGKSHQFIMLPSSKLKKVPCPKGWMSREGYNRYLKVTLAKMAERKKRKSK